MYFQAEITKILLTNDSKSIDHYKVPNRNSLHLLLAGEYECLPPLDLCTPLWYIPASMHAWYLQA